jgi:two-component system, NarL family, nitrate/nitrite response regulator NarL
MRVLICDDHALFAESLALVLQRAGFDVVGTAPSVDHALVGLRRVPVDVCVLDLLYPARQATEHGSARGTCSELEVSSVTRLPELRAAAPTTKFLLLSGQLTGEVVAQAKSLGVRGFALKGCRVSDIVAAVSRLHSGELVLDVAPTRPLRQPRCRLTPVQHSAKYLTSRERQVLGALVTGADTTGVAKALGISWTTARSHIQSVLTKLGAHSRLEAATSAVRHGVVRGDTGEWLL